MFAVNTIKGDNLRAMVDLSDNGEDDETMDVGTPKTVEEKAHQQHRLVESFGSEKQKRLLANARQSKVDVKDLNSSMTSTLPAVDHQCKIIILIWNTVNSIHIDSVESISLCGMVLLDTC